MKIILTQDLPGLGRKGEVKEVKEGFFRNFLSPQGKAVFAEEGQIRVLEERKKRAILKQQEIREKAEELKKKIEGLTLTFKRKTTAKEKLYGAIKEKDLIEALEKKLKIKLEQANVVLPEPLKTLGGHEVKIALTEEITAYLKIKIEKE